MDDQLAPLRAFSLTHVQYTKGDPLGFPVALVTLSPVFVMVVYAALILLRRDLATMALCAGQLGNEAVNYVLKHAIKEPRPVFPGAHALHAGAPKYGMPSDHSQFMAFLAAYMTWWAFKCWRVSTAQRLFLVVTVHVAALACAGSRVYLGYHTLPQVAAGVAMGLWTGSLWFRVVQTLLRPAFPAIADGALGRLFQLRDCSDVDDVLSVEYEAIQRERRARRKQRTASASAVATSEDGFQDGRLDERAKKKAR